MKGTLKCVKSSVSSLDGISCMGYFNQLPTIGGNFCIFNFKSPHDQWPNPNYSNVINCIWTDYIKTSHKVGDTWYFVTEDCEFELLVTEA